MAGEQLRALEAEHIALDARRREFEARVDRLARQREERRRLQEQDQAGRARERIDAARRRLAELADLEQRRAWPPRIEVGGADLARTEAQHRMRTELTRRQPGWRS